MATTEPHVISYAFFQVLISRIRRCQEEIFRGSSGLMEAETLVPSPRLHSSYSMEEDQADTLQVAAHSSRDRPSKIVGNGGPTTGLTSSPNSLLSTAHRIIQQPKPMSFSPQTSIN
ncbi:hypothetical protein CRG98_037699 [Punica granatum]|uniref:Uncharacterized protein n=1 Tax=Punica granatum TaxID=22663 RepID=A0A2I0ID91_PUNGR|nr:hypothetical protein CRG98_037699 [Punica granatum]